MKLGTKVTGDDPPAPVDFGADPTTVTPPVGHYVSIFTISFPDFFSQTVRPIVMKLDTKVTGDDQPTPVDFGADPTTVTPPVGHYVLILRICFQTFSHKPFDRL